MPIGSLRPVSCSPLAMPSIRRGDTSFPIPDNVAFYERFGFEVADDALPLLPGGPTQWGMRRPAKSAT
jgi:hypothetical protein